MMSLELRVEEVTAVLLADGWHKVDPKSFRLGSYEFLQGGQSFMIEAPGTSCGVGFLFTMTTENSGHVVCGPLTSILAVRG